MEIFPLFQNSCYNIFRMEDHMKTKEEYEQELTEIKRRIKIKDIIIIIEIIIIAILILSGVAVFVFM